MTMWDFAHQHPIVFTCYLVMVLAAFYKASTYGFMCIDQSSETINNINNCPHKEVETGTTQVDTHTPQEDD